MEASLGGDSGGKCFERRKKLKILSKTKQNKNKNSTIKNNYNNIFLGKVIKRIIIEKNQKNELLEVFQTRTFTR